jgi:hypothetical protein
MGLTLRDRAAKSDLRVAEKLNLLGNEHTAKAREIRLGKLLWPPNDRTRSGSA